MPNNNNHAAATIVDTDDDDVPDTPGETGELSVQFVAGGDYDSVELRVHGETVSTLDVFVPSLTVSWNWMVEFVSPSGAVNVGCAAVASLNVTLGPLTCVHE